MQEREQGITRRDFIARGAAWAIVAASGAVAAAVGTGKAARVARIGRKAEKLFGHPVKYVRE